MTVACLLMLTLWMETAWLKKSLTEERFLDGNPPLTTSLQALSSLLLVVVVVLRPPLLLPLLSVS